MRIQILLLCTNIVDGVVYGVTTVEEKQNAFRTQCDFFNVVRFFIDFSHLNFKTRPIWFLFTNDN